MKLKATVSDVRVEPVIDGQNTQLKSCNKYVWRDEKAAFVIKDLNKKNTPAWGSTTPGFEGLVFPSGTMTQVWVDFHIGHDIALNTRVYPHVHWMPLTTEAGFVRWGFQYVIAKGHGQSAFPVKATTVLIDHSFPANSRYVHFITEVSDLDAILTPEIEPDTMVKMRVFREGSQDRYKGKVHAWQAGLHYQVARIGTINRAPDFYV